MIFHFNGVIRNISTQESNGRIFTNCNIQEFDGSMNYIRAGIRVPNIESYDLTLPHDITIDISQRFSEDPSGKKVCFTHFNVVAIS